MTETPRRTRTICGRSALLTLGSAWRRLQADATAGPTMRLEWVQAYLDTLGSAATELLQVVTVEDQDRVVAIAPMLRTKKNGVVVLESIGVRETNEPADLLYEDADVLVDLFKALFRLRVPLAFPRIPLNSATVRVLRDSMRYRGGVAVRPGAACPSLALGPAPDSLLNAGRRSDMRRARKKAEKVGAITTRIVSPAPSELPPLIDVALQIEAAGWKGKNRSALLCEHPNLAFFQRFFALAAESGILRVALLHIGGQPAAMQLAVECSGSLWLVKIGYDERFAGCSPGSLLMWDVLVDAVQRGLKRCEFLGNAEPWTRLWTNLEYPCASVHALPLGYASLVYLARHSVQRVLATRSGVTA